MRNSRSVEALSSAELSRNLVYAGLFLVAAELIKELVVTRVKEFYSDTVFGPGLPFTSYAKDVRSRHKIAYEASLLFLRDHLKALGPEHVLAIQAVRERRNKLAHELAKRIVSMNPVENEALLTRARSALFRLSNLWTYFDIGADPELASKDIDWTQVYGEELMLLDHVIEKTRELRGAKDEKDG